MESYQLELTGFQDEYQSPHLIEFKEDPFYLRITCPDSHADDSFFMEVPAEFSQKTIQEALDYTFPNNPAERAERRENLEVDMLPDLPSVYDYLANLLEEENVVLDWSANLGPRNISLDEIVDSHCCLSHYKDEEHDETFKILHLVIDEYDVPFKEYEDPQGVITDKQECRGLFLHYMIANHGLNSISKSQNNGAVKDAVEYCERQNLITVTEDNDAIKLEMTDQGEKQIQQLEAENQYYADTYEIFASVYVEDDHIEFGAEEGVDLRMTAMRYDEINPYRAAMVINLFTGAFDGVVDNWEQELQSDKFFARYLGAAAIAETDLTDEQLESVMIHGKEVNEG